MVTETDTLRRPSAKDECAMALETAARALIAKHADREKLLAIIDQEFAADPEAVAAWAELRWKAYEEQFSNDPPEVRAFLPNDLRDAGDWSSIVDRIAERGFLGTLVQANERCREEITQQLLFVVYHPVAFDKLYFRVCSQRETPLLTQIERKAAAADGNARDLRNNRSNHHRSFRSVWGRLRSWVRRSG